MPWWAPITWVHGQQVSTTDMNQQVRDNLRYLKGLDGPIHLENAIDLEQIAAPSAPAAGRARVYAQSGAPPSMAFLRTTTHTRPLTHASARVYRTSVQSLPPSTWTDAIFQDERFDTADFWSSSAPATFSIPATGVYLAGCCFIFDNVVGVNYITHTVCAGTVVGQARVIGTGASLYITLNSNVVFSANAGDAVQISMIHTHTSTLNLYVFSAFSPEAWIVGPL